jgi:hypothetical protein
MLVNTYLHKTKQVYGNRQICPVKRQNDKALK